MLLAGGYYWLVIGWWLCGFTIRGLAEPRIQSESQLTDLCSDARCSCSPISVTCHCSPQDQEATLSVDADSMPRDASYLIIDGCRDVVLAGGAVSQMEKLQRVDVVDVGRILFRKDAFNQAQVEQRTTVNVDRCRHLTLESRSVTGNSREPVSFSASNCHVVDVEASVFSAVQHITLSDVEQLHLASLAFRQAPPIATNITIQNARVKELKGFTFPSPVEQLRLLNVSIGRVESNATSALRIAHLSINGSHIGIVAPGAFSQLTLFDSFEIHRTSIRQLEGKALASATSLLTMEDCIVGEMSGSAVSMPAAGVRLRRNRIGTLSSGALDLREWNDVLIEDNTFGLVERQAFYNIAEPRLSEPDVVTRLVVRRNEVMEARPGAFIFSAQALRVHLVANRFGKACDCQLVAWTADLTQVKRREEEADEKAEEAEEADEIPVSEALWLGSSLFHNSSCRIDSVTAQCTSGIAEGDYLYMVNYTSEVCIRPEVIQCMASLRRNSERHSVLNQSSLVNDSGFRYGIASIGLNSIQDVILVSITAILASAFLLALLLGLVYARRRTKPRRAGASGASGDEDRCTPLMADTLGSGVVSSGSISRLSVKDYNDYLAELGPIYSEPLDPPFRPAQPAAAKESPEVPPELPARSAPDSGSLASEFTQEILAALRMEVSPTYSQVMDSIPVETKFKPKLEQADEDADAEAEAAEEEEEERELYDQITVMLPADHIYCKPWTEAPADHSGGSPSFPPPFPTPPPTAGSTLPPTSAIHPAAASGVSRTLPKWPPQMAPPTKSPAPPKPVRMTSPTPNICDYADPRDVTDDHFYSELNGAPQYATVMNN